MVSDLERTIGPGRVPYRLSLVLFLWIRRSEEIRAFKGCGLIFTRRGLSRPRQRRDV
jgi:hypothetical protein